MPWNGIVRYGPKPRAAPRAAPYLTIPEVARNLGVHVATVRRWVKQGRLAAVRLGSTKQARMRIATAELRRFLTTESNWIR